MDNALSRSGRAIGSQRLAAVMLTLLVHLGVAFIVLFTLWQQPDLLKREIFTSVELSPEPQQSSKAEVETPPRSQPRPTPSPSPPAPPMLVLVPSDLPVPPPIVPEAIAALLADADLQAAGGACDLTGPVQAALRLDPEVQRLLPSIPPSRRSVAMAIALWNREWVPPDAGLDASVLDAIQLTVVTTVDAASVACRSQVQAGPRLVYLPGTIDTVLALGSGEWTWQDVADTARPVSPETNVPVMSSRSSVRS